MIRNWEFQVFVTQSSKPGVKEGSRQEEECEESLWRGDQPGWSAAMERAVPLDGQQDPDHQGPTGHAVKMS